MCDAHNINAMARCLYTVGNVVMGFILHMYSGNFRMVYDIYSDSFEITNPKILDDIEAQHNTHSLYAGKILTKLLFSRLLFEIKF